MEVKPGGKRPTCYVFKSFRNKHVKPVLQKNTDLLMNADSDEMFRLLDVEFQRFEDEEARARKPWLYYRLHWSGDIFNIEYAQALADATALHNKTTFWMYTRSFDYVEPLLNISNLKVYLSLDQVNMVQGIATATKFKAAPNLSIAVMDKTTPGVELAPCPQDSGKVGLEGACCACGICPNMRKRVWFPTK